MAKKYFTLIIVPDATSQFKQFKVPYLLTRGLIVLMIIGIVAVSGMSYYMVDKYRNMKQISKDLPVMRKETGNQKYLIEGYEQDITELRQMVSRLKLVNAKLMLMAGVEDPSTALINFPRGGEDETSEFSSLVEGFNQQSEETMVQKIENLGKLRDIAVSQEELSQRLMEFFQDQQTLLASTPSVWPVRGWVTSGFGRRKSPFSKRQVMHPGIDIATKTGTPIAAPADGTISFSGTKGAFGKVVVIDHGYSYTTFYGHCSKLNKKLGDKVKRGDIIAYVGNSGRSTGPHLHYEVRVNGVTVDPTKYILDF